MRPARVLAAVGVVATLAIAATIGAGRTQLVLDATAEGSASLSEQTLRVLDEVRERIRITAVFPRDAVGRVEAATLLSRYRRANRKVTFRVIDPRLAPGEAERLGIVEVGSAAVQDVDDPERIEIAQYTIEIDLTSAIARLVRGVDATVCFTAGHGERDPEDATAPGMSQAARILSDNGYRFRTIDLLAAPRVPRSCDAVVVASPASSLGDEAARALGGYLEASGKAFLLADPAEEADLTPLSKDLGISFLKGIVLEGDRGSRLPDDVTSPIVTRYAGDSPPVRGVGPTFFPRVMGVRARDTGDPGLSATEVAITSPLAYLDRRDPGTFDPEVDVEGPVAVGAAADRSDVSEAGTERARIRRTRILAWGDVDFASNAFIGEAANARLWIQGIDWLTQPEDLVTAVPTFPKVRELKLTAARSRYLVLVTAGLVPALFLIAGGVVWVLRRGR